MEIEPHTPFSDPGLITNKKAIISIQTQNTFERIGTPNAFSFGITVHCVLGTVFTWPNSVSNKDHSKEAQSEEGAVV